MDVGGQGCVYVCVFWKGLGSYDHGMLVGYIIMFHEYKLNGKLVVTSLETKKT